MIQHEVTVFLLKTCCKLPDKEIAWTEVHAFVLVNNLIAEKESPRSSLLFAAVHNVMHLIQMLLQIFGYRMFSYNLYILHRAVDAQ